ncbi:MAG: GNAT family N-acetyltransferase [Betaproteobacteria bacterium]
MFDEFDVEMPPDAAATAPGFFNHIASGVQSWFQPGAAKDGAPQAALDPRLAPYVDRIATAETAVGHIRSGSHVFIGTASATPRLLVGALETMSIPPADLELVHFLTTGAVPHDDKGQATTRFRHRTFFVGSDIRAAVSQGLAEYVPLSIARVPELIANGRIPIDVALIQVSMPDPFGYVSLGVSVDVIPAAIASAGLVIAEVNARMPRTMGDSTLHISQLHHLVPVDSPVIEYEHPATEPHVVEQIARYISGIIEDGSTLQIGLGRVTSAALKYLSDRKDIGIHSDVITDDIIPLLEKGVITGRRKSRHRDKIVTSFAIGTKRLYDLIDGNPLFCFQPIDQVCQPSVIAAQHRMVSVTQAFAVDLTGQVCVDQLRGDLYAGLAAQGEFLRGASRSEGGKAIICLASTSGEGNKSSVQARLEPGDGVTIARNDVHYVITEYGIAYLFGKSIRERAVALIQVAHPKFRAELFAQGQALGYLPKSQTLQNMRAYPVEEEVTVALKDKRSVLLRPALSADGEAVRSLFHSMSEADVFTRFFRHVRALSGSDVQRLCNVNFENEVAFVAVTGTRENPQIVAQACYFIDPSTNLAETAFMVSPAWQGCGLGAAMQRRMGEHAAARGVRGFVAEIMATNANMIRLSSAGSTKVTVEPNGTTVRVTALF